jgi:hypothetical protein
MLAAVHMCSWFLRTPTTPRYFIRQVRATVIGHYPGHPSGTAGGSTTAFRECKTALLDPVGLGDGLPCHGCAHGRFRNLKKNAANNRTIPTFTASRSQNWCLKNRRSTPTTTTTSASAKARRLPLFPSLIRTVRWSGATATLASLKRLPADEETTRGTEPEEGQRPYWCRTRNEPRPQASDDLTSDSLENGPRESSGPLVALTGERAHFPPE